MKSELKLLKVSITNFLNLTKNLTLEQLNVIPSGFSNNIIWNVAHLIVTHRLLVYGLSSNDLKLEAEFVDMYRKGSKPSKDLSKIECDEIFKLLESQFNMLEKDLEYNIFKEYKNYPTSYNFEITNLEDAIAFNNLHFGLHFSVLLKLLKAVK